MADANDLKETPSASQTASSELRPAEHETKLVTNPSGGEAKETGSSIVDTISNTTSEAATSVGAAATGVKDSVFSMFGGGEKKPKKADEDEDAKNEPSGSSKAKKDDDDEVCIEEPCPRENADHRRRRKQRRKRPMSILTLSSI